ncbi:MAG: glycoside hydrolase family 1 protein [Faecousia sp.]
MEKFYIGAATAAHQVEGNNTYCDFWAMENMKYSTFNEPSGVCCDHYNRYEQDIKQMADAGLNAYRFSIEWARIEPKEGQFDLAQVAHYRKVIDCCYAHGLTPIVTLMHFSSPAWLIKKGGWGKEYVVKAFARYAGFVAKELGNRIPYIATINEANMGYQLKKVAQDMMSAQKREGDVQVGVQVDMKKIILGLIGQMWHFKTFSVNTFLSPRSIEQEAFVMQAHQAAKKAIKAVCPDCKVGLTVSLFDYQPTADGAEQDKQLWKEDFGFYLPYICNDDFLGVQNYSRKIVDENGVLPPAADVTVTQMGYEDYPESIGNVLRRVAKEFPGELLVTENGIATDNDERRCEFIQEAVAGVMKAKKDGVPVIGYCYWSLLDNFEWQSGFDKTFGLIAVDRKTQIRAPKRSLTVLGEICKTVNETGL